RPDSLDLGGKSLPVEGKCSGRCPGSLAGGGLSEEPRCEVSAFPDRRPWNASEHRPTGSSGSRSSQVGGDTRDTGSTTGSDHPRRAANLACPECGGPLNEKCACWKCHYRRCYCGRPTGSAHIELCWECGEAYRKQCQAAPETRELLLRGSL